MMDQKSSDVESEGTKREALIRAGPVPCIHFMGMPQSSWEVLAEEFGSHNLAHKPSHGERAVIEVQFGGVEVPEGAEYVGRNTCHYDGNHYVREGSAWAKIPTEEILRSKAPLKVACDSEFDIIRLVGTYLEPLLRIQVLEKGHAFIHSSSVTGKAGTILFAAWGNTGKTNLVLELQRNGAQILTDDWSLLTEGGRVVRYPRPINLMNYNFELFPEIREEVSPGRRVLLWADRRFRAVTRGRAMGSWGLRGIEMVKKVLDKTTNTHVPFRTKDEGRYEVDRVYDLKKVGDSEDVALGRIQSDRFVQRHTNCFLYENRKFLGLLRQARFAEGDELEIEEFGEAYRSTMSDISSNMGVSEIGEISIPEDASREDFNFIRSKIE